MTEPKPTHITLDELKTHSKPGNLWISIHGQIYDVSKWAKTHPGGDLPLLHLAGQDVTDAFLAYHPPSVHARLAQFSTGLYLDNHIVSDTSHDFRNILSQFTQMHLFDKKGHTMFFTILAVFILFFASVYGVIMCSGIWVHLFSGILLGLCWIQSGWIGHDSGHYQVLATKRMTRVAQVLSGNCLAGISIAWWKRNHNAHHIACNSLEFDPDLQHMPFFVVSAKFFGSLTSRYYDRKLDFGSVTRSLVSYQHLSFYPVMCLARINLFAQSFILLLTKRNVANRVQEILGILVFWIWFPLLVSRLPNLGERVLFVVASFSVCGIQHVQFCLNHFSSSVYVGNPGGNDWFEKQTSGTLNITCSKWMDWFHGGLQFQVEHHLFPRLPRCHLRKISPFVRDLCKKHGLSYETASFLKANELTLKTLRTAALQARDLTSPVPKNLVWEAINTHG